MTKVVTRRQEHAVALDHFPDCPPRLAHIFYNRGLRAVDELNHDLEQLLPFSLLSGIDDAVQCLLDALEKQARILIIGDFDVDGATSTTLAVSALRAFGAQHVDFLVPNRFEFGYGLTPEIVAVAKRWNPDLIITVDNGISSHDGVTSAREQGIKVLITDHHLCGDTLPDANAIVNPNCPNDVFPSKNLAGVGVIFYVMLALRAKCRELNWFAKCDRAEPNMAQFLDLVALGTVADVVKLDRNNRILVKNGMQRIRTGKCRPGILALLKVAKRDPDQLLSTDLGYALAPRLNAAGRMDDMSLGIDCLLSPSFDAGYKMALQLEQLNQERIKVEKEMAAQAYAFIDAMSVNGQVDTYGVCLYDASWHQGVIGIIASRIKERFYKPTVVFAPVSDTEAKGSARSISEIHIRDLFQAVSVKHPHLLQKFGGHAMAAGMTIAIKHIPEFQHAFNEEIKLFFNEQMPQDTLLSDGELEKDEYTVAFADRIYADVPWGSGFPEPVFDGVFNIVQQRLVGTNHLKLTLKPVGSERLIDAIMFGVDLDQWPNHRAQQVHATYRLDINHYRGLRTVQLIISHLQHK
jgi:single-stranded-DNA-specific exonuclease